ncbi:Ribonuclease H-like protein [Mycena indigotica]|uniref:ribonuclease H n=1 Tax=Mycena indigotica TaxID=2126181 RepID=A0A8H6W2P9_9AGAR|nr:Ribonuclease H-like protein [Mycena indigotica]KAF7299493.1 Ribonuclease H-like protein [Mycena indigotica]
MSNRDNGIWTASKFVPPPNTPPEDVFGSTEMWETFGTAHRFLIRPQHVPHIAPPKTLAIYIDGACFDNGTPNSLGGVGFVFNAIPQQGTVSFALEKEGPVGNVHQHTNNRAELRAAIAALEFRAWYMAFNKLVLITDSEYVANGATTWIRTWAAQGWNTTASKSVANRDLWEKLILEMKQYADGGCDVSFWAVPREWNQQADQAAKDGAGRTDGCVSYSPVHVSIQH